MNWFKTKTADNLVQQTLPKNHGMSNYDLITPSRVYNIETGKAGYVVSIEPDPANGALVGTRLVTTVRVLCGLEGQDVNKSISATLKRLGESGGCTEGSDGGEPTGAGGKEGDGGSDEARDNG